MPEMIPTGCLCLMPSVKCMGSPALEGRCGSHTATATLTLIATLAGMSGAAKNSMGVATEQGAVSALSSSGHGGDEPVNVRDCCG